MKNKKEIDRFTECKYSENIRKISKMSVKKLKKMKK